MCMAVFSASAQKKKENGSVYSKHPAIKMVQELNEAFIAGDSTALADLLDDEFKLFDALSSNKDQEGTTKAQFNDMNRTEPYGMEENKAGDAEFLSNRELIAFDERGYPDYMEYDWLEARVVQSWWNIRLKKKGEKDAEEVVVRMLRMDDFNAEGKITSSDLYYNAALLAD